MVTIAYTRLPGFKRQPHHDGQREWSTAIVDDPGTLRQGVHHHKPEYRREGSSSYGQEAEHRDHPDNRVHLFAEHLADRFSAAPDEKNVTTASWTPPRPTLRR